MNDTTRNILTGITGIVALLGFAALLMLFGEISSFGGKAWPMPVSLNDSGGVREGSVVTFNGVPVGTVERVDLTDDAEHPVLITVGVDADRRLPRPLIPLVSASLIGGGATLQFQSEPGVTRMNDFYPTDGSVTIVGEHTDLTARLTQTIGREAQRLAEALSGFREGFDTLATTYAKLGRDLDDLVRPLDAAESEAGVSNLRATIAKLNAALDDARGAIADSRLWLGDGELRGDVRSMVVEARGLVADGRVAVKSYGDLATSLQQDADALTKSLVPAADELSRTLEQVRAVAALAAKGDGTIASLLTKPDLYRSLLDASQRLEKALDETQLLLRKVKEEGLRLDLK
jgi:ABC-type transporter Mla subunit MlaD